MILRSPSIHLIALVIALLALTFSGKAQAQGDSGSGAASSPVNARGTSVSSSFQFGDVDSVNLFNGNLSLQLPVGPTYPAGGNLSHGLNLAYNSNIWEWVSNCEVPSGMGGDSAPHFYQAPDPLSNAGLGWTLNPGMILAESNQDPATPGRTTYYSPDGGRHEFYPTLHPNVGAANRVEYTRDGSYLRLRSFPAQCHFPSSSPPSPSCVLKLDFPDGTVHTFEYQSQEQLPVPFEKPWRVTEIRDPFDNWVGYEYLPADSNGDIIWKVTDSFRSGEETPVTITFEPSPLEHDEESHRIRSMRFLTFGGEEAVYEFTYQERPIDRSRFVAIPGSTECDNVEPETQVSLSQLVEVRLDGYVYRDGLEFVTLWRYGMEYYLEESDIGAGEPVISKPGAIRRLQLPTGGGFEWEYAQYLHGREGGSPSERTYRPAFGVRRKGLIADMGTSTEAEIGRWIYQPTLLNAQPPESPWDEEFLVDPQNNGGYDPCFFTNRVTDPEGNYQIHYFNTARRGFEKEFGQPYTVCSPGNVRNVQGQNVGVLFDVDNSGSSDTAVDPISIINFSNKQFTSPPETFQRPDLNRRRYLSSRSYNSQGNLLREKWVDYEYDDFFPNPDTPNPLRDKISYNPRLRKQETSYCDDPREDDEPVNLDICSNEAYPSFNRSTHSDFDGLGNYRFTDQDSTFGGQANQDLYTRYNPQGNAPPSAGSPWLLNLFDRREIAQGLNTASPELATTLFCFNNQTGFLEGTRALSAGGSSSPLPESNNDLLTRFTPSPRGHVSQEDSYGGDGSGVAPGSGCGHPGGTPQYRIKHSYDYGALATSNFVRFGSATEFFLNTANNVIDPYTGIVAKSTDAAGVETSLFYDELGRHTRTCVPGARVVIKEYDIAEQPQTDGPFESSVVTWTAWNEGGCIQGKGGLEAGDSTIFDSLGRKLFDHRKTPTGQGSAGWDWAERGYTYNALGWPLEVTVWSAPDQSFNAARTIYSEYDRFGRPGLVTAPDGSQVTTTYVGDQFKETRVGIQTGQSSGIQTRVERQYRDGLGRLYMTEEGSTSNLLRTTYRHDEGGRLSRVCVNDDNDNAITCSSPGQGRLFNYDGRGLLISESHPELGGDGSPGTNTYLYDALGNVIQKQAPTSAFNLDYRYDSAGRITQVYRPGVVEELHKEFFYARKNIGDNLIAGKLFQAKRHNRVRRTAGSSALTDVVVTETFGYTDAIGRQTDYSVRTADGPNFTSSIDLYDYADNPAYQTYPYCDSGFCSGPLRQTRSNFLFGFHTRMQDWVAKTDYNYNGEVFRRKHWTGVQDFWVLDDQGWRLNEISVATNQPEVLWETDEYSYDPAGNIKGIGANSYRYDLLGRLTSGTVQVGSVNTTQSATYDVYGNLTSLSNTGHPSVTGPSPGAIAVNSNSNRLDAAGDSLYDANGNLEELSVGSSNLTLEYDAFNRLTYLTDGTVEKAYLYTAGDERLATLGLNPQDASWTPRSATNQVLRRYREVGGELFWDRDYMYAGSTPIGSTSPTEGVRHFHTDHLGTIRLITDGEQEIVEERDYYPFGGAIQMLDPTTEPLQFTGHERDIVNGQEESQLDYMHARYYTPHLGRFSSIDPVNGNVGESQSWNRYTYVQNDPIGGVDPDGKVLFKVIKSSIKLATKGGDVASTFAGIIDDVKVIANPTASLGQKLIAGLSLATELASPVSLREGKAIGKAVGAVGDAKKVGKTDDVAVGALEKDKVARMASEVREKAGRNRVSGRTAGGKQVHIDLEGRRHHDKASGEKIDTPHVHESKLNFGPNGKVSASGETTRPATAQDIRIAEKLLEKE